MPGSTPAFGRLTAVLVVAFLALTAAVAVGLAPLDAADHAVARWGFDLTSPHPALRTWWAQVSTVGQPMVLRGVLLVVAAVQAWRRRWDLAAWLVAVVVVENVVAPLSKLLVHRPRPHWQHPIVTVPGLGYPSGHSAAAGMLITAVTLLALTTVPHPRARAGLVWLAAVLGLLVAASRILLGVHYLTDVLAGLLLGASLTLLCWSALARHRTRRTTREPAGAT